MPSSVSLDLGAWSKFLPQERNNDPDYNQLLYKFRQFYNEVKEFQELHSDCSVTRAAIASAKATVNFNRQLQRHNGFKNISHDISINNIFKNKVLSSLQNPPQHHSSSYNLSTGLSRPEAKQRNAINITTKINQSKSSERIDNLDNNNITKVTSTNLPGVVHSLDRYVEDDESNIYDAVSPEDALYINGQRVHDTTEKHSEPQKRSSNMHATDKQKDQDKDNLFNCNNSGSSSGNEANCFGVNDSPYSSNLLDASATSYSVSSLSNTFNNHINDSRYANYVNIDYFLKRRQSPSFDHSDDEDNTQMSNSLSTDHIFGGEATSNTDTSNHFPHKISDVSAEGTISSDVGHNNAVSPTAPPLTNSLHRSTQLSLQNSPSNHSLRSSSTDKDEESKNVSRLNLAVASENDHKKNFLESSTKESLRNDDRSLHVISENKNQDKTSKTVLSSPKNLEKGLTQKELASADKEESKEPSLAGAHQMMQSFLSDLNLTSDNLFQNEGKSQRRIVKESFAVEFCGKRKLRHLFLFNDVIVCAKYQASSKQKFTFDVKWYLSLIDVSLPDFVDQSSRTQQRLDKDTMVNQILSFKTNLCLLRNQIDHLKRAKQKPSARTIKKLKRKKTELEAELVLLLPHLPLTIKHTNGKKYTFFLSSNFERNQWIDSIKVLQNQLNMTKSDVTPSSSELQAWIQTCRKNLNPNLGSFLLRSNSDEDLFYGDLNLNICRLQGLNRKGNYYFSFEVDSYGHFFQKASSSIIKIDKSDCSIDEDFIIPLDGTHTMRFLFYEDLGLNLKSSVMGKTPLELSRSWFDETPVEKIIPFGSNCSLTVRLSYSSSEHFSIRYPDAKIYPNFGVDVQQVCKKEKSSIPILVQLCVREVERRGMKEIGIYRMSGQASDIQRLRKSFETNSYGAEFLLREIDIHSVTGLLKLYLREMPEALFTNKLYSKFVEAFNLPQSKIQEKERDLVNLFNVIPPANQRTIIYLIEHLVKVNKYENYNKMSLANLATVFGLNMIRPAHNSPGSSSSQSSPSIADGDPFTAVVISSMSQAGILYFFLCRKSSDLPLTE